MNPETITRYGMRSAVIEMAIPWVEDMIAAIEIPDHRLLDGLEQLRQQIRRPPSIERASWRPPLHNLYALRDEKGPSRQAAIVLLSLIRAECNRDDDVLLHLSYAWRETGRHAASEECICYG